MKIRGIVLLLIFAINVLTRASEVPTEADISQKRIFGEPLIAMATRPSARENAALTDALTEYAHRLRPDDFSSLVSFLATFPNCAWSPSLRIHLGTEFYNAGYYSEALETWEAAWQQCKSITNGPGRAQADLAVGELARMYSKLGRVGELQSLLDSVANRSLHGPATSLIHDAQQALWMMQARPEVCFRCGPLALDEIVTLEDPKHAGSLAVFQSQSTTNGFSLAQVAALSAQLGLNYQMAFRSEGAPLIVPSVIHWKVGHYAALLEKEGNRFLVKDHTFQSSLLMTTNALDEEASGYFLVPTGALPPGWRAVSQDEGAKVFGKGNVASQDGNPTGPPDGPFSGQPLPSQQPSNAPPSCGGMTVYSMHTMLASLSLFDLPVGYTPPVGPSVKFVAYYSQNEKNQPASFGYSNLGADWDCNWLAFITDNPGSPGVGVTCYGPGGGTHSFTGFNSSNKTFSPELMTQVVLVKTASSSYEMRFPDGVKWEFTQSDGSSGSMRRIFLTQVSDPAGNTVQLNYDTSLRITNIVDAIGQATTLNYGNPDYPFAITQVTDPFGRSATFQYNSDGLLSKITDVLSISSQFSYGANDFVTNLTTPYGTTVFASGTTNGVTWLKVTDPLGESELLEAIPNNAPTVGSDPSATIPAGMLVFNQALDYRNSYFWDKKAFENGAVVYTNATIYHFLHAGDQTIESDVLESEQKPFENRVWFSYPGQAATYALGQSSINRPALIGRVLDAGETQLYQYQYNPLGHITNSIDPTGRNFTYIYSSNNVDLLQVRMTRGGKNELLSSTTYNSQHKPLTLTDAAGQSTTNTYNASGQILTSTDPLNEVMAFNYDSNGYLTNIIGHLQNTNDITSFTYDTFGRVQTVTDTEGYTLSYAYDAMDRITNIAYPDGTSQQFVYSNLDRVASADRLGRWTTNAYNADRQLTSTRDPLGRIVQYEWCHCGAMTGLIDSMGRKTSWEYDLQSRPVAKTYADGSRISYTYENTTSRLKSRVDEQGQETDYRYNVDNTLATTSYPNPIVSTPTVILAYDPYYKRLAQMKDGIGATTYSYFPITVSPALGAGKLASTVGPLPNSTVTYQYDQLGRITNRAINGVAETVGYDSLGRPYFITNELGAFQYSYLDATTRLASGVYPNGQTNLYSYCDNLGDDRLQQITHRNADGSFLDVDTYGYNSIGQILSWTNDVSGTNPPGSIGTTRQSFTYDAADQLTNDLIFSRKAGLPQGTTSALQYSYDSAGNRLQYQTVGFGLFVNVTNMVQYTYNALNQLIAIVPAQTNSTTYEWDAENRLTAINQGTNRSEFTYDGLGRRVRIVELMNGVVQSANYYLWCGSEICEMRDATGANVVRRLFHQGEVLAGSSAPTNYYYAKDHVGSIREVLNSNGSLVNSYSYDPYGQMAAGGGGFQSAFGFTCNFVHRPTGLYLTWFRALDSRSGRWLSRDPLAERFGPNLYVYVTDNPINRTDRFGLADSNARQMCNNNNNNNNKNQDNNSLNPGWKPNAPVQQYQFNLPQMGPDQPSEPKDKPDRPEEIGPWDDDEPPPPWFQ
jgi:RHS repeat-associated protein